MIAHILTSKYLLGVPFYRLEQQLELQGASLDRGTMCRYAEDAGATLGAIVEAARKEAFETAFCLSMDATGVSIQPGPIRERKDKKPGPCRKGHFFVVLADKDHVFFDAARAFADGLIGDHDHVVLQVHHEVVVLRLGHGGFG
ncbi:IS66 family transposase [Sorangium sp. So ce1153]|uniref:IS66 family transposase n=1 Tax=Sorangium sp. So ce1153 TaxID=3133333 RepID=UPI003F60D5CB